MQSRIIGCSPYRHHGYCHHCHNPDLIIDHSYEDDSDRFRIIQTS